MTAQFIPGHVADIHASQGYAPAGDVVEAHEQVDEGGFAAARGAHNGNALARLHPQVEVLDQRAVGQVLEGHILKGDGSVIRRGQRAAAFRLGRLVHQLHQAAG